MNRIRTKQTTLLLLFLTILFCCTSSLARAGGAGSAGGSYRSSGSSSSNSYSGGSSSSSSNFSSGSYSTDDEINAFFAMIMILIFGSTTLYLIFNLGFRERLERQKHWRDIRKKLSHDNTTDIEQFVASHPDFESNAFKENVRNMFLAVQEAWSRKDMSSVRTAISDGVWQRFTLQFELMNAMKQTNTVSQVAIKSISIVNIEESSAYDVIHTAIVASCRDEFSCELDIALDSGGKESFVEYWSFIRRKECTEPSPFARYNCPSCSAPIENRDLGEYAACPHCNAVLNQPEYGWILSEITQADDWNKSEEQKHKSLDKHIAALTKEYGEFSVQRLEDIASNVYIQLTAAQAFQQPLRVRRFLSRSYYDTLKKGIRKAKSLLLYLRFYLREVTLIGVARSAGEDQLYFSIVKSAQRVKLSNGSLFLDDQFPQSSTQVLKMVRKRGATSAKYSIYMHRCGCCGAPVNDSEITCQYCQSPLNSSDSQWIVDDLMSLDQYKRYTAENSRLFGYSASPKQKSKKTSVNEIVLKNLMVIAYGEKRGKGEINYLMKMAHKMGYDGHSYTMLKNEAQANRLSLHIPEDPKVRAKVLREITAYAKLDNTISTFERGIIEQFK